MARARTAGTRQLVADIDEKLRDELDQRVKIEQRTLRIVVERALAYYLSHVPAESALSIPVAEQPKRGRPRKAKGE